MFRTLLVAVVLLVTSAALVATPARAQQLSRTEETRLKVFIDELLAFSRPYQAAMDETNQILVLSMEGMEKALDMSENGSTDDAWIEAWARDVTNRSAAVRARLDGLPPFPVGQVEKMIASAPSLRPRLVAMTGMEGAYKATIASSLDYAISVIPDVRRLARGDSDAAMPLYASIIAGTRLIIRSENAMLELQIAAAGPASPQGSVSRGAMLTNDVLELLMAYQEGFLAGDSPDVSRLAKALRGKALAIRQIGVDIRRGVRDLEGQLSIIGDPVMRGQFNAILKTYESNVAIEEEIAGKVDALAAALERGDDPLDAMTPLLDYIDVAVDKRNAILEQRSGLLVR